MANAISNQILAFAGGEANLGVYKMFADYWNHWNTMNGVKGLDYQKVTTVDGKTYELSFSEKEDDCPGERKRLPSHADILSQTALLPAGRRR